MTDAKGKGRARGQRERRPCDRDETRGIGKLMTERKTRKRKVERERWIKMRVDDTKGSE